MPISMGMPEMPSVFKELIKKREFKAGFNMYTTMLPLSPDNKGWERTVAPPTEVRFLER